MDMSHVTRGGIGKAHIISKTNTRLGSNPAAESFDEPEMI